MWVAAYGPKALALTGEVGDGFILQLADPSIAEWTIKAVRDAADGGRPRPRRPHHLRRRPGLRHRRQRPEHLAHAREQCRWFGGMVGNHVADIVARYGDDAPVPKALTDYIKGREGYDYNEHGQAGNTHTTFVPDEIVDRFCIIGPVDEHVRRLSELKDARRRPVLRSICSTTRRTKHSAPTVSRSCPPSPTPCKPKS